MKKFLFVATIAVLMSIFNINAQIELRNPTNENKTIFKNPTENKEFNTNAVPFDEKVQDGPRMDLNKFGVEQRRNLNIQQGNYNHYNQQVNHNQNSIVGNIDRTNVNRPQSAALNNNQFNYNQNASRKVSTDGAVNATFNTPMQVKPMKQIGQLATVEDEIIETAPMQRISVNPEDGSSNTETPTAPGGDPNVPIEDAIPFLVLIAGIYAFILRRKQ